MFEQSQEQRKQKQSILFCFESTLFCSVVFVTLNQEQEQITITNYLLFVICYLFRKQEQSVLLQSICNKNNKFVFLFEQKNKNNKFVFLLTNICYCYLFLFLIHGNKKKQNKYFVREPNENILFLFFFVLLFC